MNNELKIKIDDQLYVNNRWYFDVIDVIESEDKIKVRIKYYENPNNKSYYLYKTIKLPLSLFKNITQDKFIIKCTVIDRDLKEQIGGLIDRIIKESDITKLMEDVGGMGAVSNPGLSGTPGVPGSAGSGDISTTLVAGSVLPANEFGLEIDTPLNKKVRKKLNKSKKDGERAKPVISAATIDLSHLRIPILNIIKEEVTPDADIEKELTDNDYKTKLYQFLDYPTENDIDHKFMEIINKWRPDLGNISAERLKIYFKNLYQINKRIIDNNCSDWFKNYILILID